MKFYILFVRRLLSNRSTYYNVDDDDDDDVYFVIFTCVFHDYVCFMANK